MIEKQNVGTSRSHIINVTNQVRVRKGMKGERAIKTKEKTMMRSTT